MSESIHATKPAPWMYTNHATLKGGTIHTVEKDEGGLSAIVCRVDDEATARRIIKAYNEHEELIEVLWLCRSVLSAKAGRDPGLWRYVELADAILPKGPESIN